MGKRFSISNGTAWCFMHKVRKAMASSQKYQDLFKVHDKNKDPNLGFISLFVSLLRRIFKL